MAEEPFSDHTFKAVKTTNKLSDMVVDQVEGAITEGHFSPGERLPAERKLAQSFGVGRSVIREATRVLEQKGLVEIRPGLGVFVSNSLANVLTDSFRLFVGLEHVPEIDVFEVRVVLETGIAGYAASRADDADLEAIGKCLVEMERAVGNPEKYIAGDINFHLALARATHNDLFVVQLNSIVQLLRAFLIKIIEEPGDSTSGLAEHRAIFEAIRDRKADEARAAMRHHLYRSLGGVRRATAESATDRSVEHLAVEVPENRGSLNGLRR